MKKTKKKKTLTVDSDLNLLVSYTNKQKHDRISNDNERINDGARDRRNSPISILEGVDEIERESYEVSEGGFGEALGLFKGDDKRK